MHLASNVLQALVLYFFRLQLHLSPIVYRSLQSDLFFFSLLRQLMVEGKCTSISQWFINMSSIYINGLLYLLWQLKSTYLFSSAVTYKRQSFSSCRFFLLSLVLSFVDVHIAHAHLPTSQDKQPIKRLGLRIDFTHFWFYQKTFYYTTNVFGVVFLNI